MVKHRAEMPIDFLGIKIKVQAALRMINGQVSFCFTWLISALPRAVLGSKSVYIFTIAPHSCSFFVAIAKIHQMITAHWIHFFLRKCSFFLLSQIYQVWKSKQLYYATRCALTRLTWEFSRKNSHNTGLFPREFLTISRCQVQLILILMLCHFFWIDKQRNFSAAFCKWQKLATFPIYWKLSPAKQYNKK